MSWERLVAMMQQDFETQQRIQEAWAHNFDEVDRVQALLQRYWIRCILTFGLYSLFVSKPTAEMREIPREEAPFSLIFFMGPQAVVNGVHELVDRDMLRRVQEGEGEEALDVFFPTSTLLSCILRKQASTPAS